MWNHPTQSNDTSNTSTSTCPHPNGTSIHQLSKQGQVAVHLMSLRKIVRIVRELISTRAWYHIGKRRFAREIDSSMAKHDEHIAQSSDLTRSDSQARKIQPNLLIDQIEKLIRQLDLK